MKLYAVAAFAALLAPAGPALAHHCRPIHHHRVAWHRPVARHRCACGHRFVRHHAYRRPADVEVTYYQPRLHAYYRPYPVYYAQHYYGPRYYGAQRFHHWERGGFEGREHGAFRGEREEHGWRR